MELNNNLFTLCTISRSFDKYHVDNNKVHLVSSIKNTRNFKLTDNIKFKTPQYIINIEAINLDDFNKIEHNSTCVEFKISLSYFLKNYPKKEDSSFESFLEVLIGKSVDKEKENRSLLNNVLFVYNNMSWPTIQAAYKSIDVDISGGSISKRQGLTTAEYNLSSMLFSLGYSLEDIFKSSILLNKTLQTSKNKDPLNSDLSSIYSLDLELNNLFRWNSIAKNLTLYKGKIEANITSLELEVKSRQGSYLNMVESLNNKIYSRDTPKYKKLKNNILNSKAKIEKLTQDISSLNSKVTIINTEISTLPTLSPSEVQIKYNKLVSGVNIRNDVNKFKNYFKKRKLSGVIDLNRREYSTLLS